MQPGRRFPIKPYRMVNPVQPYIWGTKGSAALIPKLLRIEAEPDKPYAELWMGAHPKAPSQIQIDGDLIPLDKAIESAPEIFLGTESIKNFGRQLPFLCKVLSAAEMLSIQVHPDKTIAQQLHQLDPVNYPDTNHKPEIAYVLDELECLAGFRPIAEICQLIDGVSELQTLFPNYRQWDELPKEQVLYNFWQQCLDTFEKAPELVDRSVRSLSGRLAGTRQMIDANLSLLHSLVKQYIKPDLGLLLCLFLQYRRLSAGQALYLPPRGLHAYIKGNILECMANSDNVVRAGLTPKYIDLPALKLVVDPLVQPVLLNSNIDEKRQVFQISYPDFILERIELDPMETIELISNSIKILFVWDGKINLCWSRGEEPFSFGCSALIPGKLQHVSVKAETPAVLFISSDQQ